MLPFSLGDGRSGPLTILCVGAHSDDIEIGCGATILRLLAERPGSTASGQSCRATPSANVRLGAALRTFSQMPQSER